MKLGVCVPYRNREAHLEVFVPRVAEYLKMQGIEDFCMYFGHQRDTKLFNRGLTKNVAAKYAFEDGCDYIVWHDIDMIPEEGGGADYSYPGDKPVHIATNISQMNYDLKYFEYFGGAVLFTKDQVERTNGYSNEYWDWGMEDDDLFWRCYLEGLLRVDEYCFLPDTGYLHFSGEDASVEIPVKNFPGLRNFSSKSHTVSILCRAYQQPQKQEIYLLGDQNRKYIEYPIFRIPGYDYGISFNNSKTLSLQFWNSFNQHNYMWAKRYDQQWSWVTVTFDVDNRVVRFYLNGMEVDAKHGHGSESPMRWVGRLKSYGPQSCFLGTTPSVPKDDAARYFKGDIAKVRVYNRVLDESEVIDLYRTDPDPDDIILNLDFSGENKGIITNNVVYKKEDLHIPHSMLPVRKPGRFTCLYHRDEGIVNGRFAKGEPTARNERRYMLAMQQGKVDYKRDGIAQLEGKYKYLGTDQIAPWAKMINIETVNAPS